MAEAGAVAAAGVERAVGAELQVANRVRGVLLAPVFDQNVLQRAAVGFDRMVAGRGQPDQPAADLAGFGALGSGQGSPVVLGVPHLGAGSRSPRMWS